jgi:hypothetical protein
MYSLAGRNSRAFILSPWINTSVVLNLPFGFLRSQHPSRKASLLEVVNGSLGQKGITTIFYLRPDPINDQTIQDLESHNLEYHLISKLHLKAIITEKLLYTGSANITQSGIYRNQERCNIELTEAPPDLYLRDLLKVGH